MANDIYKSVLFNDGEGLDYNDLNNLRAYSEARMTDQVLEHLAGACAVISTDPDLVGVQGPDIDLTSLIYTMTGGDGVLKQGTTSTRVGTYGGTIFQKIATADGDEATFLPYTLAANEFDLVVGAGHATLNRVDIVQVKLEWVELAADQESRDFEDATTRAKTTTTPVKKRRVQATVSLKAGTAATPPTYPAPDAGYALLGAVFVPAAWTANISAETWPSVTTHAKTRQCSIPLNIKTFTVMGVQVDTSAVSGAGSASLTTDGCVYASGGDISNLRFWCPLGGPGTRVVGVAVHAVWQAAGNNAARLSCFYPEEFGGVSYWTAITTSTLTSTLVDVGADALKSRYAHLGHIADGMSDSNPSAANGPIGDGMWCGGARSGPSYAPITKHSGVSPAGYSWARMVALDVDLEGGSMFHAVTFYLAG